MTGFSRRAVLGWGGVLLHQQVAFGQSQPAGKWLPLPLDTPLERIAFGSCLHQRVPQPIWKSVIAANPQLFLMTGDNVYGDVKDASVKEMITAYAEQSAQPEFAAARETFPFLAIWDDHDFGLNDASSNFPHKVRTRQLFAEFWNIPESQLPADGVYRSEIIGPAGKRVQVILLDLRYNRSEFAEATAAERLISLSPGKYKPDASPEKTMLGAAQWAWFEQQLRKPAEIRIIVSSTQLLAEHHGFDRWGQLPAERERFFKLLGSTGAKGVVVVSGDRHRAAIYKRTTDVPYTLYDVTSSALNISRAGGEPEDAGRLSPMLAEDNFGMIRIDWTAQRLQLELMRMSGIRHDAVDLAFSDLGITTKP